jgi:CheY-like chemotaxis protein/HPt (histidine-containing phosphotransfer) domain-containing protein
MSELAAGHCGKERCMEYITGIKHAGANLLSIINDILDFSKIESGRMEITNTRYETASLLNDVLMIAKVRLVEKTLKFEIDLDESVPTALIGDEIRVRQILFNLLSNAVKYTSEGFIRFTVGYEVVTPGTVKLIFIVADSGIGIKSADISRLFANFIRVEQKRTRAIEGTGLGLAITHSLCRAMGGDINVVSEYGVGSTFTATVTQGVADASPMGPLSDVAAEASGRDIYFTAPDFRILIVDDMDTNLTVAEGLTAPYKMQTDVCRNGEDALALIGARSYDLVFMDHMMPGMDGVETTHAVRAMPGDRFKTLPVIALTANAVSGMKEMFLEEGFNDFLSKPIEVVKLDALLKKWIPAEKRRAAPKNVEEAPKAATSPAGRFPDIAGVDVEAGIDQIGGSQSRYRELLTVFRRDAEAASALLAREPRAESLRAFTTRAHALKSALASIGARELSREAALLEKAGREADTAVIREHLAPFREALEALSARIAELTAPAGERSDDGEEALDPAAVHALARLREALDAVDVDATDSALMELQSLPLSSTVYEAASQLAEFILKGDFPQATEAVAALLARNE